jgi:hypothetical protein
MRFLNYLNEVGWGDIKNQVKTNRVKEEGKWEVGAWIKQNKSESTEYAILINQLKNKNWSVISIDDDRMKPAQKSTKGWYPAPVIIASKDVPVKIKKKMIAELKKRGISHVF